jgi:hypothetical protein
MIDSCTVSTPDAELEAQMGLAAAAMVIFAGDERALEDWAESRKIKYEHQPVCECGKVGPSVCRPTGQTRKVLKR